LYRWDGGQAILKPQFPWEFVQIGNCGSPIELDQGWLLLTHGVGPVRKYSIGAALLDKNDPAKVLAGRHLKVLERTGRKQDRVAVTQGLEKGLRRSEVSQRVG